MTSNTSATQIIQEALSSGGTELYLSYQDLDALPDSLWQMTQLETLILSGNRLTELPAGIGRLTQLNTLDLSGNQLATLPEELGALANLRQLDLAVNQLTRLPPTLGNLGNLQILECFGNQLVSLPPSLTRCHNLTELRVRQNTLSTLPDGIEQLISLMVLDLSYNELQHLPLGLYGLGKLKELYLVGNPLNLPFEMLSRGFSDPHGLLTRIHSYLEEKQSKEKSAQADQLRASLENHYDDSLAQLLVLKTAEWQETAGRITFHLPLYNPRHLTALCHQLSALQHQLTLLHALLFALEEDMQTSAMKKLKTLLNLTDTATQAQDTYHQLAKVSEEEAIETDVTVQSISLATPALLTASISEHHFPGSFVAHTALKLWLALRALVDEQALSVSHDQAEMLVATFTVILGKQTAQKHAVLVARGMTSLALTDFSS